MEQTPQTARANTRPRGPINPIAMAEKITKLGGFGLGIFGFGLGLSVSILSGNLAGGIIGYTIDIASLGWLGFVTTWFINKDVYGDTEPLEWNFSRDNEEEVKPALLIETTPTISTNEALPDFTKNNNLEESAKQKEAPTTQSSATMSASSQANEKTSLFVKNPSYSAMGSKQEEYIELHDV